MTLEATPCSIDTQQINPPANPDIPSQPSTGKKKYQNYLILGILLIFIFIGVMAVYLLGGENFVMSLPFMPKSTKYVLQSSITAHEKMPSSQ